MFSADVAIWRVWQACGGAQPEMVAGHSLGEYAALVCAEVLSFKDAAQLVCHRGRLMADAFAEGEGAVGVIIKATQLEVEAWCKACSKPGSKVAIANINSPIQLVIAGHTDAVKEVLQLAKQNQAKMARLLPVSVPVHCQLMQPTAEAFQKYFSGVTFHEPKMPMVFNADALCHLKTEHIQKALYEQLFNPVQWVKIMDVMMQNKPGRIVESGPGGVLTGLLKRTFRASECGMISLNNLTDLQEVCSDGA
jgi:[acyl-carrier-protein] S-malonyltransferase